MEDTTEYSAEIHRSRGYELMIYFPEKGGIEKEEDIFNWESKDLANRMAVKFSSRDEYNRTSPQTIKSMFP